MGKESLLGILGGAKSRSSAGAGNSGDKPKDSNEWLKTAPFEFGPITLECRSTGDDLQFGTSKDHTE